MSHVVVPSLVGQVARRLHLDALVDDTARGHDAVLDRVGAEVGRLELRG